MTTHIICIDTTPAGHAWIQEHQPIVVNDENFPNEPAVRLRLTAVQGQPGVYALRSRLSWPFLNAYVTRWLRGAGEPTTRLSLKVLETGTIGGGSVKELSQ
jgi:hypothetical protein